MHKWSSRTKYDDINGQPFYHYLETPSGYVPSYTLMVGDTDTYTCTHIRIWMKLEAKVSRDICTGQPLHVATGSPYTQMVCLYVYMGHIYCMGSGKVLVCDGTWTTNPLTRSLFSLAIKPELINRMSIPGCYIH